MFCLLIDFELSEESLTDKLRINPEASLFKPVVSAWMLFEAEFCGQVRWWPFL